MACAGCFPVIGSCCAIAGFVNKRDAPRTGGRILDVDGVMKLGSNGKGRMRGRNNQPQSQMYKGRGPSRNQVYDSNGPGVRVRGNAHQVVEKYQALARDAAALGDRLLCENYLQHAEHYLRIILAINQNNPQRSVMRLDQGQALEGPDEFYEDGEDLQEATVEAVGLAGSTGSVTDPGVALEEASSEFGNEGQSRPRRPRDADFRPRSDRRGDTRNRRNDEHPVREREVFSAPVPGSEAQPFVVIPGEVDQAGPAVVAPAPAPAIHQETSVSGVSDVDTAVSDISTTDVRKPRRRRAVARVAVDSVSTEQAEA